MDAGELMAAHLLNTTWPFTCPGPGAPVPMPGDGNGEADPLGVRQGGEWAAENWVAHCPALGVQTQTFLTPP